MKNISSKTELTRLKKLYKKAPKNIQNLTKPLLQNAAFMAEQLDILQEKIIESGWTEGYKNGANQYGRKESANSQVYNKLIKNYASVIRDLKSFLPEEEKEDDAFMKQIKGMK